MTSEVDFLTGINSAGAVLAMTFKTWNTDNPASYNPADSSASKWAGSLANGTANVTTTSAAGSAGGTLYYYFDPASNWTTTEQSAFVQGLSLWSAEANIQFAQETTGASAADLVFKRGSDGGAHEDTTGQFNEPPGATALHNQGTGVSISIDTSVYGFGNLGNFAYAGGYSVDTVVHEEGHFLSLGHGGPYNGNVDPTTQQYSAFDTRQWTLMSYINPGDTSAKYYSDYTVTGTNWNIVTTTQNGDGSTTTSTVAGAPTTPMPLDILGAQRLYGVATTTPLNGGQTFGFHCNVAASIKPFFDFSVNTNPIVTLFDSGAGNTLDLSGYNGAATVSLLPGTFSSFDNLTNNLGIDVNTKIDGFVGTAGSDSVIANNDSDTITFSGTGNTVTLQGLASDYSVQSASGALTTYLRQSTGKTYAITGAQTVNYTSPACYAAGTRILTTTGERAVESLAAGDLVVSVLRQRAVPILWVGHRHIDLTQPAAAAARPVRVTAGAFGDGQPHADLLLSPEHAVFVDGVLVPVRRLVNHSTIRVCNDAADVTYFHLELPRHDVVLADGLPAESWLETGNRAMFENADEMARHPAFASVSKPCASIVEDGPALTAIRARLTARAAAIGAPVPAELVVVLMEGACAATLPAGVGLVRLASPACVAGTDRRRLGALVRGIAVDGVALDLATENWRGFHDAEDHDGAAVRWTDGDAVVPVQPVGFARVVVVDVAHVAGAEAARAA